MNPALPAAVCRTVLAGGVVATITATARPRGNRAEVKCNVPGNPALAQRMQYVVRAARLTEPACDPGLQVVLGIDRTPQPHERDWELAAVIADRMVRGALAPAAHCANGWSAAWHLGRVDGHDIASPGIEPMLLGGEGAISHLGQLAGQGDPAPTVSSARAWFPMHAGGQADRLCWVEVSVCPRASSEPDEEAIAVPGVDAAMQLAVRSALCGARHFDGRHPRRWRTLVTFEEARLHGRSYELALVMADRLARGRDFPVRGRLLASGSSAAWHAGQVDEVAELSAKAALIAAQARAGDRILLPRAAAGMLGDAFVHSLRERAASVAFVDRIGLI